MTEVATRTTARRLLGDLSPLGRRSLLLVLGCLLLSLAAAYLPQYDGLPPQGVNALFILLLCAGLWITEAMPAFAVSLLAIGLAIALLGNATSENPDWEKYVATWGSPLIWLFFGGFILTAAAKKTGLDQWMASQVLQRLGSKPAFVLFGVMAATAVLSMFLSNTATAALMVAAVSPMFAVNSHNERLARGILLGIAVAANIGGMGTIIGTPPNAIAVGTLSDVADINFLRWMAYGIPPAVLLLAILWCVLVVRYFGQDGFKSSETFVTDIGQPKEELSILQLTLVVVTFFITVLMWMASPLHGIPTPVVSFIPICVLTTTGVLDAYDVRSISWDVLLLIAGGLSLGIAIGDSGLAGWFVEQFPFENLGPALIALVVGYVAILLSNLMSNTAAANIILPITVALLSKEHASLVIPIALSASAAMCLPISTPPNAIVYGTEKISSSDLMLVGLIATVLTPPIVVGWTLVVESTGLFATGG